MSYLFPALIIFISVFVILFILRVFFDIQLKAWANYIVLSCGAIFIGIAIYSLISIVTKPTDLSYLYDNSYLYNRHNRDLSIVHYMSKLKRKNDSIYQHALKDPDKANNSANTNMELENKVFDLERKLNEQIEITTALRQSLNPINPDEILKISRLTEGLIQVKKDMNAFKIESENREKLFQESSKREIDTLAKMIIILGTLSIPMVIGFLLKIWDDIKKKLNSSQQP